MSSTKRYILLWQVGGELKRYQFLEGTYYIGRALDNELGNNATVLDYYTVYIIPENGELYNTSITSTYVSRHHLKIVIGQDKILFQTHGPYGTGARNPTRINERVIHDSSEVVELAECTSVSIRLTPRGPHFIMVCSQDDKGKIMLLSGAPTEVPSIVAEQLVRNNLAEVLYDKGESKIILPKPSYDRQVEVEIENDLSVTVSRYADPIQGASLITDTLSKIDPALASKITKTLQGLVYDQRVRVYGGLLRINLLNQLHSYIREYLIIVTQTRPGYTRIETVGDIIMELRSMRVLEEELSRDPVILRLYKDFLAVSSQNPYSREAVELARRLLKAIEGLIRELIREIREAVS